MFEVAELGRALTKQQYTQAEPELHTALLEVQRRARAANLATIVVVSGVEGAGKGTVVSRLNEWLDARGIQTHAFWEETDEERQRPYYWRFWRALPPRGAIGILFGSWYTRPIVDHVYGRLDEDAFERQLHRIVEFEQLLTEDGALIVKLWFHLSRKDQQKRLREDLGKSSKASPILKKYAKRYKDFLQASERAIRVTDTGPSTWHVIEAQDRRYRDITAGRTVLDQMRLRLEGATAPPPEKAVRETSGQMSRRKAPRERTVLDEVDLARTLTPSRYEKKLEALQAELYALAWKAHAKKRTVVAVFEGWDAAGKGGAIRRVTNAIDARLYRVISVAAPTDEEKAQHYLWRFWRQLPRAGQFTIYDRSWYGRVLVERVEQFAREHEWRRAYQEINDFEEQLIEHGIILLKFWLHISADEQLRRFKERERIAWKKHKITAEDWRNREKWDAYELAVNDMVAHTSSANAPWTLVPGNDKRVARVEVLKTFCRALEKAL